MTTAEVRSGARAIGVYGLDVLRVRGCGASVAFEVVGVRGEQVVVVRIDVFARVRASIGTEVLCPVGRVVSDVADDLVGRNLGSVLAKSFRMSVPVWIAIVAVEPQGDWRKGAWVPIFVAVVVYFVAGFTLMYGSLIGAIGSNLRTYYGAYEYRRIRVRLRQAIEGATTLNSLFAENPNDAPAYQRVFAELDAALKKTKPLTVTYIPTRAERVAARLRLRRPAPPP